jgi:hypothetical protein
VGVGVVVGVGVRVKVGVGVGVLTNTVGTGVDVGVMVGLGKLADSQSIMNNPLAAPIILIEGILEHLLSVVILIVDSIQQMGVGVS